MLEPPATTAGGVVQLDAHGLSVRALSDAVLAAFEAGLPVEVTGERWKQPTVTAVVTAVATSANVSGRWVFTERLRNMAPAPLQSLAPQALDIAASEPTLPAAPANDDPKPPGEVSADTMGVAPDAAPTSETFTWDPAVWGKTAGDTAERTADEPRRPEVEPEGESEFEESASAAEPHTTPSSPTPAEGSAFTGPVYFYGDTLFAGPVYGAAPVTAPSGATAPQDAAWTNGPTHVAPERVAPPITGDFAAEAMYALFAFQQPVMLDKLRPRPHGNGAAIEGPSLDASSMDILLELARFDATTKTAG